MRKFYISLIARVWFIKPRSLPPPLPPLAGLHLGFHLDQQWPVDEMRADMEAIKNDLGADIVRMGEFMWHELEPMDGQFK